MSKLDLLTANDVLGKYPPSHYAADKATEPLAELEADIDCEICIIGAGLTGLSAALSLAKAGRDVVVLEASRIGFGASGRNGGQIGIGQRLHQYALEKLVGPEDAKTLFQKGVEAHDYVQTICADYQIDIGYHKGIVYSVFSQNELADEREYAHYLHDEYGYDDIDVLENEAIKGAVNSPRYVGGLLLKGAGHGDPLALTIGLAKAARDAGARIFEKSRVLSLNPVTTLKAKLQSKEIILACNGYLDRLDPNISRYVMPINNFIIGTEILGEERAQDILPQNNAIADSKFVVNYFRRAPDHRLLFGGGESYGYRFPKDIAKKAYKPMVKIFPQLHDVNIDFAWGGTLGITMNRMPFVRRFENIWVSAGYSGHGVALAVHNGDMLARAIMGDDEDFALYRRIPHRPFPGGAALRQPILVAAMSWYSLRDKFRL